MTLKCLMVDVDGVVVRHPQGLHWDHAMEADLGLRRDHMQTEFFHPHFRDIVTGKRDLHEVLAPVLARIAPHLTSQEVTDYWFGQDSHLDRVLLDDLAALRAAGMEMHLATVQEHHRARYLWDVLGLKNGFGAIHYSADYGVGKPDPAFFKAVEARTGWAPSELLLLDDRMSNVEAARACGWGAILWDNSRPLAQVFAEAGVTL